MEKKIYITKEEQEKCRKVADAFTELYEIENILVMDAGRFGYVKLQYYRQPYGFDDVITFTDSQSMFSDLWEEWLNTTLILLTRGTPMAETTYEEMFQWLPEKKQKELLGKKAEFAKRAEIEL